MKERPILFCAPMVRAILDGRKTQTRRVYKGEPTLDGELHADGSGETWMEWGRCPYGKPGDRLWVRENGWERPSRTAKMMRDGADTWERFYYDADGLTTQDHEDFKAWGFKRRPSRHMPRWASRITLEITGVRVERLQDISEEDALAEGINRISHGREGNYYHHARSEPDPHNWCCPIDAYRELWQSLHSPESWGANPWVWMIEFRRAEQAEGK